MNLPPFRPNRPNPKQRRRIRKVRREFQEREFGEELARVNFDLSEEERHRYMAWMRQTAREHGINLRAQSVHAWMDCVDEFSS